MYMDNLYSERYPKVSNESYKSLVSNLDKLTGEFYKGTYYLVEIENHHVGICCKIKTGSGSSSSLRRCEPVMIEVDPFNLEGVTPAVFPDRIDFDFCAYPHINPGEANHRSLCLTRENFNDWYAEHTFRDTLKLIQEWFKDASKGGLIKYKNGDSFEPITVTDFQPMFLALPSSLDSLFVTKVGQKIALYRCVLSEDKKIGFLLCDRYQKSKTECLVTFFCDRIIDSIWDGHFPDNAREVKQKLSDLGFSTEINRLIEILKTDDYITSLFLIRVIKRPVNILDKGTNIDYKGVFISKEDFLNDSVEKLNQVKFFDRSSREQASYISGTDKKILDKKLLILGCGAIGSKLCENFYKSGLTNMTICDNDKFLMHNVYRHNLNKGDIWKNKAEAEISYLNSLYPSKQIKAVDRDANDYLDKEDLKSFDAIIDATASANVFRKIDRSKKITKSMLVIRFALSNKGMYGITYIKQGKLNEISDFYYYLLYCIIKSKTSDIDLSDWIRKERDYSLDQVRIGEGCHSATMVLSDDIISIHSGLASLYIKNILSSPQPLKNSIFISQVSSASCKTCRFEVEAFLEIPFHARKEWKVKMIKTVSDKIREKTFSLHKKETGGYLLGSVDEKYHKIYVIDTFIPDDNKGTESSLVLGTKGWDTYLNNIMALTSNQVYYIGDWHSHPKGGLDSSNVDKKMFESLSIKKGLPPYMLGLITNGREKRAYLITHK